MTEPTPNFNHDAHLRHVIENPVQGGDTRTAAEINAEAERIARAEREAAAGQATDTQPAHRVHRPGMSKGAKIALGIGVGAAVAVAGTVGGIAAFGPKANDDTTQGGTGNGEGTDGNGGGIEGNTITIEVSPESLAGLTQEQIAEALSTPAVDAEGNPTSTAEAIESFEQNLEGLLNAGTTDAEAEPYMNTPGGQYEGAISGIYDQPGLGAIFYDPDTADWISLSHTSNLTLSMTARVLDTEEPFMQNVDVVPAEGANLEAPATEGEVPVTVNFLSNAEELGLIDFYSGTSQQIDGIDRSANYTLKFVDVDGKLKAVLTIV